MPPAPLPNHPQPFQQDDELIVIHPDTVAARLLPQFLARRVEDLALIDQELARAGYRAIERVGHNLKGIGRTYGMDGISEIGAVLEKAGQRHDATEIRKQAAALAEYLRRVQIAPA
ncbi:MAG: Hpt domain-containing protein [Acidobacteriota bacterium]|nr:Hpt domain-containing protein [Acidobacteriota bacterium]